MSNSTISAPRKNLLQLALEQAKPIWHSGEAVKLITDRQGRTKAYLKEMTCVVYLCTVDQNGKNLPGLPVFRLDVNGWIAVPNIESKYTAWVSRCQAALNPPTPEQRQAAVLSWYRSAIPGKDFSK